MSTLQYYRRQHYPTMADFANAFGCGTGKATTLLQGRHALAISDRELHHLAEVLHISFEQCLEAMSESYNAWQAKEQAKKPAFIHQAV